MLNRIENLVLTDKMYLFSYRNRTESEDWEKFHAHQGLEFLIVHEGKGKVVIDQQLHEVTPGTLVCFQPYQLHRIRMESRESAYTRSMFVINPTFADPFLQPFTALRSFFQLLWKGKLNRQIFPIGNMEEEFDALFRRFRTDLSRAAAGNQQEEELALFTLSFLRMLRSVMRESAPDLGRRDAAARSGSHPDRIMEWIERHYKEPFSLERLSEELHLSSYHVSHVFTENTGFTITEYLIARRLREACLLLSATSRPINLIGQELGWSSTSYFSQLFKRMIGLSPRAYRAASQK